MSQGKSYFDHDIFSNSFLTVLKEQIKNKELQRTIPKGASFFIFGTEFEDSLLYNVPPISPLIMKMVQAVRANSFYQSAISHPKVKIQHEYYKKFYDLHFKCKTDIVIPEHLVPDIKSTACTSWSAFTKSIFRLDYDRQIYIYMTMSKCDYGAFIACSKEKNPKVFIVSVRKNDNIYLSGKRKTEELINVLKSFM